MTREGITTRKATSAELVIILKTYPNIVQQLVKVAAGPANSELELSRSRIVERNDLQQPTMASKLAEHPALRSANLVTVYRKKNTVTAIEIGHYRAHLKGWKAPPLAPDPAKCRLTPSLTVPRKSYRTPQQPNESIRTWFVLNLVPKGTSPGEFLGCTLDCVKSQVAVDECFRLAWEHTDPVFYEIVDAWLPDLACMERKDGRITNEDWELLFSEIEQQELLHSFGFVSTKAPVIFPKSLASLGYSLAEPHNLFLQFKLSSVISPHGPCLKWWPSRTHESIIDLAALVARSQAMHTKFAETISNLKKRAPAFSVHDVVASTFKALDGENNLKELQYNTGGSIYAEPTRQSSIDLSATIAKLTGDSFSRALAERAVLFVDLGAGTSTFVTSLARPRNCPAVAIEYDRTRSMLATNTILEAVQCSTEGYPFKTAYIPMNIYDIHSLEPPSDIQHLVVYLGDEAFDMHLLDRICALCSNVSVPLLLITDKAGRHSEYKGYWESRGNFVLLGTSPWKKRGGNNQNGTFFIYSLDPAVGAKVLEKDLRIHQAIERCGNEGSNESRFRYYTELLDSLMDGTYPLELYGIKQKKRKRCSTMDEEEKKIKRLHCPSKVVVAPSQIHGSGLFATKPLQEGTLLVQFGGAYASLGTTGPHIITTNEGHIDVSECQVHGGKSRYINHSCVPNVRLIQWVADDGNSSVSIESTEYIEEGQEIVLKYDDFSSFSCCCPACKLGATGSSGESNVLFSDWWKANNPQKRTKRSRFITSRSS